MELTTKQKQGLEIAVARYYDHERYTVIAGYAGAGKSTLIKFIINALNLYSDNVAYIAYTGKAAEVLRRNGCPNAMTAHKLLYYSHKNKDGSFTFKPRSYIGNYKIIVVDEVSMIPKPMWELLLAHHIYVLACGDPFQLPPVSKDPDMIQHVLDTPHIFLDEIMRQAQDNEIIKLSMDIREGREIRPYQGNDVRIYPKTALTMNMCDWADQIITATNRKRQDINKSLREFKGFGPEPEPGDKVISLSNHWNVLDDTLSANLINGTIGYLGDCYQQNTYYSLRKFPNPVPILYAHFVDEINENFNMLAIDYTALTTGEKYLSPQDEMRAFKHPYGAPFEFNYGYAITCHRAQGSQWNKVLVVEEKFPFEDIEHRRWLYTAVTRAIDKVVIILA